MEYRQLGRSGLRISKLGLGTMVGFKKENQKEATSIIHKAIDEGINFIDMADCYTESEETVGNALAEGNKREKVVLTTKFGWYMGEGTNTNNCGANRKHIIAQCEESLRRLKTEYIDNYVVHVVDATTPMEEMLYTLDMLVKQGKVRYIGTSKYPSCKIVEGIFISQKHGWAGFVSEQLPYSLLDRAADIELISVCRNYGVGITPVFPIARGLLSGKYRLGMNKAHSGRAGNEIPREVLETVEKLAKLAENRNITLAEFSLAWLMHQPGVTTPILGARTMEYLESGLRACDVKLTDEEMEEVDKIVPPGSFIKDDSGYYANVYDPLRQGYVSSASINKKKTDYFIPVS
ncbi:aldo/keto reductase [bacterium]|nr:aldo/keto reductase [bacterium]